MSNLIWQKLINANVYDGNNRLLGTGNVTLPNLEAMSDSLKGLGIAGEVDVPLLGHFGAMTVEIAFHTMTEDAAILAEPRMHQVVVRGAVQVQNMGGGSYGSRSVAAYLRCTPKGVNLGKMEPGSGMDTQVPLEVTALKVYVDNKEVIELDKFNMIYRVNGIDYLAQVRLDMGMEASGSVQTAVTDSVGQSAKDALNNVIDGAKDALGQII